MAGLRGVRHPHDVSADARREGTRRDEIEVARHMDLRVTTALSVAARILMSVSSDLARTYSRPRRIFSGRITRRYVLCGSADPFRMAPSSRKRIDAQSVIPGRTDNSSRSSSV